MKPVAIGRKNWLFVGSPLAGRRASVQMSLAGSCKENQVEPWAYLRSVFADLPRGANCDDLLPDRWLATNPAHRWAIADRRKEERLTKTRLPFTVRLRQFDTSAGPYQDTLTAINRDIRLSPVHLSQRSYSNKAVFHKTS